MSADTYSTMIARESHRPRLAPVIYSHPRYTISRLVSGGSFEMKTAGLDAHFLCVPLIPGARLIYRQPGLKQEGILDAGQITLHPAGNAAHWIAETPPVVNTINITLHPSLLTEFAERSSVDIRPAPWFRDIQLQRIAVMIADELSADSPEGSLFLDSLIQTLSARLIQQHLSLTLPVSRFRGRAEVRRVREILESDLQKDHRIEDLAAITCLSMSQLARLFREETGFSLHAFLIDARVKRATELLRRREMSIAEVAIQVGFFDQSHLTRHVKRRTGKTPAQFAGDA